MTKRNRKSEIGEQQTTSEKNLKDADTGYRYRINYQEEEERIRNIEEDHTLHLTTQEMFTLLARKALFPN